MAEKNKKSVLVVDDEEMNIIALTHMLKPHYVVYAAKCGENAIELAAKLLPDVILLDVLMPEMDGYEVLSRLKGREVTEDIPVILITGLTNEEHEEKGLIMGAADYITKPFGAAVVRLRIEMQIKISEQLKNLENLSMTDELTALPNRRSFEGRFNSEWGRACREKEPISILILDIDHFKKYNDTFGHQQGDVALQAFSKTLSSSLKRSSDFAARWGGEEFIVVLPNTDYEGSMKVAETIRKNVEKMTVPGDKEHLELVEDSKSKIDKITVSIGVNSRNDGYSVTLEKMITGADNSLYKAKSSGRNRVCHFIDVVDM